jgi:hypothetical protein
MSDSEPPTCGRCGTYRDLHPRPHCEKPRLSFWWDRHDLRRHIAGRLWLALPEKRRWSIVAWYFERHPNLCWCDLVGAAYLDNMRDDFDCGCEVPLPTDAGEPIAGECYCTPQGAAE